jgi:hypothetical protein
MQRATLLSGGGLLRSKQLTDCCTL